VTISREDFAALLVESVPDMQPVVDEYWDDDGLLLHLVMYEVLKYSAGAFSHGDLDRSKRCLDLVERAFRDGDVDVQNAVSVSFCEGAGAYPDETPEFIASWPPVLQEEIANMDTYLRQLSEQEDRQAVLVFDRDGEVMAFPRLQDAAGWMESIDVLDGEYERAFTPDGRVVEITGLRDSPVSLRITTERDDIGLRDRLMRSRARMGFTSDVDDPVSVANELMRQEWELRWPRRPDWLRRRLHGDHPPQI
jgi:uncharacterized protein YijF (DUF1287 family)